MTRTASFSAERLAALVGLPQPTPEQRDVIEAPLGAAVVIAGAGSGKTETMASRVVWLVANQLVDADAVLGLTFTRKAAAELGARIRRRLHAFAAHCDPAQQAELRFSEPTVLTYAAYCSRLVTDHGLRLGLEPATRLLSPAAVWQIADSVVRRYSGDMDDDIGTPGSIVGYVLQLAAELSDHLRTDASVDAFTDDLLAVIESLPLGNGVQAAYPGALAKLVLSARHRQQLLPLVRLFAQEKARIGAADFGDQLVWAAQLADRPDVAAMERERYRAVLLDEYQDTGHAQIVLLRSLFGGGHTVTAVGDPFQSIYGWRGASSGNIARFAADFGADANSTFSLSTSWRNDRSILGVANAVAAPLRGLYRGTVELQARAGGGPGVVRAAFLETVEEEAEWVAAEMKAAWNGMPVPRTAAVLVRRRSQMPVLAEALRAAGLPVEIVGLGGLLTTPEVADVVATLQVLADYDAGPALLRILTGARWRIGPRDLAALARRARHLAAGGPGATILEPVEPVASAPEPAGRTPSTPAPAERRHREPGSIVEALDDLGPPERYSELGYSRMTALAHELRRLRRRVSAPLPDLVAEVERTIGVDIEVAARADKTAVGRAHLDRFLDAASDFSVDADQATLTAFLAYLRAAEEEENGLAQAEIEVEADRVQLLTVHGAKGLEWNAVAVAGLGHDIFPAQPRNHDWTRTRQLLPFPLRGDFRDLPELPISSAQTRRDLADMLEARKGQPADDLKSALHEAHQREERRLAYVAFTRTRSTLILSGYAWDANRKPRTPSVFLTEALPQADVVSWFEPDDAALNPHDAHATAFAWPYDPLGERRAAVADGAALVRAAMARRANAGTAAVAVAVASAGTPMGPGRCAGTPPATDAGTVTNTNGTNTNGTNTNGTNTNGTNGTGSATPAIGDDSTRAGSATTARWRRDVELLLAERAALQAGPVREVELPATLSVSQLVRLEEDPAEFARGLARPQPGRPAPLARRGTAFHLWLERLWQGEHLLDLDELPGAADESAGVDDDLRSLQDAFRESVWAERRPQEVEVPFEMVVGAVVVRGRMDAVFSEPPGADGRPRWLVVDWKTGAVPRGPHARAAAVQLAAYRLAWQRMVTSDADPVELSQVGAAFHYVAENVTVAPVDLLDADGLRTLIDGGDE